MQQTHQAIDSQTTHKPHEHFCPPQAKMQHTPPRNLSGTVPEPIPGVVLHQPLNCSIFWKNSVFGQKMNGPPVSPSQNLQNAPTWRVPNPLFWTPFWGVFWLPFSTFYSAPSSSSYPQPSQTPPWHIFIFIFIYSRPNY